MRINRAATWLPAAYFCMLPCCFMPRRIALALILAAFLPACAQSPSISSPAQPLPSDPKAILDAAAPFYDFLDPSLKPWHMKATYQFFNDSGKPSVQGTYEEWWASPKVHYRSWTRSGSTQTEWSTLDGSIYRKDGGLHLRYFERNIDQKIFSPLPGRGLVDSGRMKLDLRMIPAGTEKLSCVGTTLQWIVDGKLLAPGSAVPSYYCFGPSVPVLRTVVSNQMTTGYDQIVKTQGHFLARQIVVSSPEQKLFSISIDVIEGLNSAQAEMQPPPDAVSVRNTVPPGEEASVKSDVTEGSLVTKTPPTYPQAAKASRIQGTVILSGVIGIDGKVRELEPLSSPSPLLTGAAIDSVKSWQYRPYLLNGTPVEVDTVINVVFSLGR